MENKNIDNKIKNLTKELKKLNDKKFKVMFFVYDTKGVPSGSLTYIYQTAYKLKELGYTVEMLYAENPNIIDNISMFMLEPDIMNMNEDFLKRVSRYKDQSSELVAIYKTNPEIFKAFSKKIDEWENTLSVREATRYEKDILRYAVAYGAYMNDAKEEDFDDVLNYCIRKAQFDFGEKYPYTLNYEEFFSKKCDELFEKKSFVDTMTMLNKVNAYTMKYLGTTYKEAQRKDYHERYIFIQTTLLHFRSPSRFSSGGIIANSSDKLVQYSFLQRRWL
jgi:hypothetical protein